MGKGLVFSWPRVWESNVIGPLLGLSEYTILWVGGRGGCARRCGGERGKGRGPLPTFKPRPPTRIHRSSKQTTLTPTLSAQPLEPTLLLLLYLPHPALRLPIHRAAHPNPIFRSRCCRPPTLPTFPLPPKQPSTEPRQIRPGRTYLPGPKPLQVRFPPGLFGRLPNAHHLPIILDTSDQTTLPPVLLGCCCLAPGHRPPRPRRSNPRPDTTKNPYSLPGVASFRLQRHFFSLRNLRNSLSFLILRPPPFRCARRVLPCCAALPCAAAILVQDQTPSSCDGSAQSSNHQKPRQPRLSPRLPPTAPRAFVFIVLGIADRCTQGA